MSYATIADIEGVLMRPLDTRETEYVQPMLDYVEAVIFERVRSAMGRAHESQNYRNIVAHVEAAAVARVLRNPDGIYRSETDGDYSYTVDTAVASGHLYLSAEELRALSAGAHGWGALAAGRVDVAARRFGRGYAPGLYRFGYERVSPPEPSCYDEAGVSVLGEID